MGKTKTEKKKKSNKKDTRKFLLYTLMTMVFGFICGATIWLFMELMNLGLQGLWTFLPQYIGIHPLIYNIVVCCLGAVLIVLLLNKYGDMPIPSEEVKARINDKGFVAYKQLGIYMIATLLPMIFGGVVGPDVGMPGIMAALFFWVGQNLKYRGESLKALEEVGFGVAFNIIFMTPLAGIIEHLEPDINDANYLDKIRDKKVRITSYVAGILGGIAALVVCGKLGGILFPNVTSPGIPRFGKVDEFDWDMVTWAVPLIVVGVAGGLLFCVLGKAFAKLRTRFKGGRLLPAMIVAVALAVLGYFFPETMSSGQTQLESLAGGWQSMSAAYLIIISLLKIILCCLCMNFEWRGGKMFPLMFACNSMGFALAQFTGVNPTFVVAVCMAACFGYIERKPLTVALLFVMCFPIQMLPVMYIVAVITSKIPNPFVEIEESETGSDSEKKEVEEKAKKVETKKG